ncbi:MAG: hypothetical protein AAGC55_19370, partial [Myxococcota bacterium]
AVKIINFSVPQPGGSSGSSKFIGVPEFIAPEVIEDKPVDQRASIYSLGCIYFFLLSGRPPYIGEPDQVLIHHRTGDFNPPSEYADLHEAIDIVVSKAIEPVLSKRFMTLTQFLGAVEFISDGDFESVNALITQPMGRSGSRKGKRKTKNRKLARTMLGGFGGPGGKSGEGSAAVTGADVAAAVAAQRSDEAGSAPSSGASSDEDTDFKATEVMAVVSVADPGTGTDADGSADSDDSSMVHASGEIGGGSQEAPAAAGASEDGQESAGAAEPSTATASAEPRVDAATKQGAKDMSTSGGASGQSKSGTPAGEFGASGKSSQPSRRAGEKRRRQGDKNKFRETMWFKKGELDSAAAVADGEKSETSEVEKGDFMPIEDRYQDDGSLTSGDRQRFSLKTGATEMMPAVTGASPSSSKQMRDEEIIGEMKSGRGRVIALIIVGLIALGGIIAFSVSGGGHGDGEGEGESGEHSESKGAQGADKPDPPGQ